MLVSGEHVERRRNECHGDASARPAAAGVVREEWPK